MKQQKTPPAAWEKLYGWVLGTARIIVILVEVVVIASFVIRVVVDTQGKNIEKDMDKRNRTLAAFEEAETNYRVVQARTAEYQKIWTNSSSYTETLKALDSLLAGNFSSLDITITADIVTIQGEADESKIVQIESGIKNSSLFENAIALEVGTNEGASRRGTFGFQANIIDYNVRNFE